MLALQLAHRKQKDKRLADRLKVILCLNKGLSYAQTADLLLLDDNTARTAYELYKTQGIEALTQFNYCAPKGYLSEDEEKSLSAHLEKHLYAYSKDIQHYIQNTYQVKYTVEGVRKLLDRLGFVYKRTKHLPGKGDVQKQQEFIKTYRELKKQKGKEDEIYFMDGVHPLHNSIPANGWIKKGQEKAIKANTGRQRMNINGACNAAKAEVIIEESETINAQSTVALFEKMQLHQPQGILHVIADNARYYRSKLIAEYIRDHPRIQLHFLPPYSPNLNLIERLWKFYKKETLYNCYYETVDEFKKATHLFFDSLKNRKIELKSLLQDRFDFPHLCFS